MPVTLQYHDTLNPVLFDGDKLRETIRQKLLGIADAWREFAKIPVMAVDSVVATGGNMNYNYTSQSDLDVHLIVDKAKINLPADFMDDWLWDKKELWTKKHPNINIHSIPVELFAQDITEKYPADQGIYSLTKNEWVLTPPNLHLNFTVGKYLKVDKITTAYEKEIDEAVKKDDINKLSALKVRFMKMRVKGLTHGGEFSLDNLIFKELRNRGAIDRMNNTINIAYDRSLSEHLKIQPKASQTRRLKYRLSTKSTNYARS